MCTCVTLTCVYIGRRTLSSKDEVRGGTDLAHTVEKCRTWTGTALHCTGQDRREGGACEGGLRRTHGGLRPVGRVGGTRETRWPTRARCSRRSSPSSASSNARHRTASRRSPRCVRNVQRPLPAAALCVARSFRLTQRRPLTLTQRRLVPLTLLRSFTPAGRRPRSLRVVAPRTRKRRTSRAGGV